MSPGAWVIRTWLRSSAVSRRWFKPAGRWRTEGSESRLQATVALMPAMRTWLYLFGLFAMSLAVFAQKRPGEAASIQRVEIKGEAVPGGKVAAVIKVHLEKGYHVHSNKPSDPKYIGTVLILETPAGVRAGAVDYPKGKLEKVAGLDRA